MHVHTHVQEDFVRIHASHAHKNLMYSRIICAQSG